MKTSKRAREAGKKNLPKALQAKKDRKSGTGQAQLTSPARTTDIKRLSKIHTIHNKP